MELNVSNVVDYIEQKYDVEKIKYNSIPLWPFLRYSFYSHWFEKKMNDNSSKSKRNEKIKALWTLIQTFCKSSKGLFLKRNKVLYFVNESTLKYSSGVKLDKVGAGLAKLYPDLLFLVSNTIPESNYPFRKYISLKFIDLFTKLLPSNYESANVYCKTIIEDILNELNIDYDYNYYIKNVLRKIRFYEFWFNLTKPKMIFVSCYYIPDRLPALYAAKKLRILVVELQHGMLGNSHFAYHVNKDIEPSPYPNYLLSFGEKFNKLVSPSIYKQNNILSTGNFYLDYIKSTKQVNEEIFKKKYNIINKTVITVASQITVDEELFEFYKKVCLDNKSVFVIFVPREYQPYHSEPIPENMSVEFELDVYQCIQNSDLTSTVYSTCCFESLALGVPCLLININNYVNQFLEEFITSDTTMYIVEPIIEEVNLALKNILKIPKQKINEEGNSFYLNNHIDLLKKNIITISEEYNEK